MKTLDDFIWNNAIELPKGLTREYMEGLSFLPQRENLIFMGTVGTGKTHLATAIALKACQEGHRVRFFTAASLGYFRNLFLIGDIEHIILEHVVECLIRDINHMLDILG